ncbi:MAG: flagellar hook assembly protein FlgD [Rickettsiales bacterium]
MASITDTVKDPSISKILNNIQQSTNPATNSIKGDTTTDGNTNIDQNYDDFLLLLTTQLKNQDPTQPLDTNQFVSQLAQLNQVEQQLNTNKHLEKLVNATTQAQIDSGINLIGKVVEADGSSGLLVNKQAAFVYDLPKAAQKVNVTIMAPDGTPVFSGSGSTFEGKNLVTWNGQNSFNGKDMPDGEYKISVKAIDENGDDMTATTFTSGLVDAVEMDGQGGANVIIGTMKVPFTSVTAVRDNPTVTATGSNTTTNKTNTSSNTQSNTTQNNAASNTDDTETEQNTNG